MTIRPELLARSALAGVATGGRTTAGIVALSVNTQARASRQPDRALASPGAQAAIALATVGEFIADKLPSAPSRLEAPGLLARLAVAALCGVVIARRDVPSVAAPLADGAQPGRHHAEPVRAEVSGPTATVACAATAVAGAVLAARLGVRWRTWAGGRRRGWRTQLAAATEDAAVLVAAGAAART